MDYEVLKPFNSVNRRFAPGEGPGGVFTDADDASPLTIEILLERKFITPKAEIAAAPAPMLAPPANERSSGLKPSGDLKQ